MRRTRAQLARKDEWYGGGYDQLVPAVKLDEGLIVCCPFCFYGNHVHDSEGHHKPPCNQIRARYEVRAQTPTEYVRVMLRHLKFEPHQVDEIMDSIVSAGHDQHRRENWLGLPSPPQ